MIAVTGSTGQLGRLVIAALKARVPASDIVAIARNAEKAADLGVAVRVADYAETASYVAALTGIDRLLLISSNAVGERAAHHGNVIAAAQQAGVGLIVYTSLINAATSGIGLADEHRATEAALAASGIPYVVLRNGWYLENYDQSIAGALATGKVFGASGTGRIAAAARADFAEAAAIVVTGEGHAGHVYELGGTAFDLAGLAAEIARASGRAVSFDNLTVPAYARLLAGNGLPEPVAQMLAGWDAAIAEGALDDSSGTLERLIGRAPTTLAAYVASKVARNA